MNSISPTKRVRQLVYDVMRSHDRKISKDEAMERARDRITMLGLPTRVLDAYPHQLSGGMKQRTVTIISTLLNPRLLVADEPTSALDVSSQKVLIEMLQDMLDRRIMAGVIFITHDLRVASRLCDEVGVMHRGKMVEFGPPSQIFHAPQHAYTQTLVAAIPGGQRSAGLPLLAPAPRR
jgi:peptide/nickel transport system ATP-binding protein